MILLLLIGRKVTICSDLFAIVLISKSYEPIDVMCSGYRVHRVDSAGVRGPHPETAIDVADHIVGRREG